MAELEEVLGGEPSSRGVLWTHGIPPRLAQPEEDDRDPGTLQGLVQVRAPRDKSEKHNARHAVARAAASTPALAMSSAPSMLQNIVV